MRICFKNYPNYCKNILFLFSLVVISINVSAADKHKSLYDNPLVDSMRNIQYADNVKALKIGFKILGSINRDAASHTLAQAYSTIAEILTGQGYYGLAEEYFTQAMETYIVLNDSLAIGWLYVSRGNLEFKNNLYKKARNNYLQALNIFSDIKLLAGQATVYNNLALIQIKRNNFKDALPNFLKALKLRQAIPDSGLVGHSYIYIGELFLKENNLKEAENYLRKALTFGKLLDTLNITGRSSELLGEVYIDRGDTSLANGFFNDAEMDFTTNKNSNYLIKLYKKRADIFLAAHKYNSEKIYLLKALTIAKTNNLLIDQTEILERLLLLPQELALGNDTLKMAWQNDLIKVYKELYKSEVEKSLMLTGMYDKLMKYKVKIKLKELQLNKANLLQNTYIVIVILSLILLLVLYLKYNEKRKKNKIILEQQQQNFNQKMYVEQLKADKLKMKLNAEERELVMKTTFIQQKNELIKGFEKELKYQISLLDTSKAKGLRRLLMSMKNSLGSDNVLADFEKHFVVLYPEFLVNLSRNYPQLSAKDLKMCAFHKMNLDTKEIAHILNLTVRAVQTSRYRIRKKMNVPEGMSLVAFLNK